jgi:hypothetical protein
MSAMLFTPGKQNCKLTLRHLLLKQRLKSSAIKPFFVAGGITGTTSTEGSTDDKEGATAKGISEPSSGKGKLNVGEKEATAN